MHFLNCFADIFFFFFSSLAHVPCIILPGSRSLSLLCVCTDVGVMNVCCVSEEGLCEGRYVMVSFAEWRSAASLVDK